MINALKSIADYLGDTHLVKNTSSSERSYADRSPPTPRITSSNKDVWQFLRHTHPSSYIAEAKIHSPCIADP